MHRLLSRLTRPAATTRTRPRIPHGVIRRSGTAAARIPGHDTAPTITLSIR